MFALRAARHAGLALLAGLVSISAVACSDEESGSAEELCAAFAGGRPFEATFEGFDPTDTDKALEQLRSARVELGRLRDVAPGEVRGDLGEEIDYVQALITALEDVGPNDPSAAVAAVQRTTEEHPDVQEAADRLEGWTATSC